MHPASAPDQNSVTALLRGFRAAVSVEQRSRLGDGSSPGACWRRASPALGHGGEFCQLSALTFLLSSGPENRFFFSLSNFLVAKHRLQRCCLCIWIRFTILYLLPGVFFMGVWEFSIIFCFSDFFSKYM